MSPKNFVGKVFIAATALILTAGFSLRAFADYFDYSDAEGYGEAWNKNPSWQRLGTMWDDESGPLPNDLSDDGVSWSIDGGSSYGHEEIAVGQEVTLKFDMYKKLWGIHDWDAIKVWIDEGKDGTFDNEDLVYADKWHFLTDAVDDGGLGGVRGSNNEDAMHSDGFSLYEADKTKSFYYTTTFDDAGEYWLRARVNCNADIRSDMSRMGAYGKIWQGETEDWKLTVRSVPEPGVLSLLSIGLLSFVAFRRKKRT